MERSRDGYTIAELLMVVAITGVLFVSAMIAFTGQQAETEFNQAMQDISSKIQSYATEVSSGGVPDIEGYRCDIAGNERPVLIPSGPGGGIGTNEKCLFLGRAIQVTPGQKTIYSYMILGNRAASTGATFFGQSKPEPALDPSDNFVLVDDYNLLNGVT